MRAVLGALTLTVALAAGAPEATGASPPTLRMGAAQSEIDAWISAHVEFGGSVLATQTADAIELLDPFTLERTPDGRVAGWFRTEFFRPTREGGRAVRSSRRKVEIDCGSLRVRTLVAEVFPQNNLQGRASQDETAKGDWTGPVAGDTAPGQMVRQACSLEALVGSPDWVRAMPPPPEDRSTEGRLAWLGRHIEPAGDVFLVGEENAALFYSPGGLQRHANGRVNFWLRSELLSPIAIDDAIVRSSREHIDVDCNRNRYGLLGYELHPGANLLGGVVAASDAPTGWIEAVAGTHEAVWVRAVCSLAADPDLRLEDARRQPDIPYAASSRGEDVEAWIGAYLNLNGYAVSFAAGAAVNMYALDGLVLQADGNLLAYVRTEVTRPDGLGAGVRSILMKQEFDCRRRRTRILSSIYYAEPNLEEVLHESPENSRARWDAPLSEGTNGGRQLDQVCALRSLLEDDVDLSLALIPPPVSLDDDALGAWLVQYVEPGEYAISAFSEFSALFYSTEEIERTRQDYIRVWIRQEFFYPMGGTVRSLRMLQEFDCDEGRERTLAVETFPGSNLLGPSTSQQLSEAPWAYMSPGSPLAIVAGELCDIRDGADEAAGGLRTPPGRQTTPL